MNKQECYRVYLNPEDFKIIEEARKKSELGKSAFARISMLRMALNEE